MLTTVTCAHCSAENEINVPDDFVGRLKWECTPCGGVSSSIFGNVGDEVVITADDIADVSAVLDSDSGGGVDAGG